MVLTRWQIHCTRTWSEKRLAVDLSCFRSTGKDSLPNRKQQKIPPAFLCKSKENYILHNLFALDLFSLKRFLCPSCGLERHHGHSIWRRLIRFCGEAQAKLHVIHRRMDSIRNIIPASIPGTETRNIIGSGEVCSCFLCLPFHLSRDSSFPSWIRTGRHGKHSCLCWGNVRSCLLQHCVRWRTWPPNGYSRSASKQQHLVPILICIGFAQ